MLNGESPLNKVRQKQADGPYAAMHFFTTDQLRALCAPFGRTTIKLCAFPLSLKFPTTIAKGADDLQALSNKTESAFIAARVEL